MSKVLIVKNNDQRIKYMTLYLKNYHDVIEITSDLQLHYELLKKDCDGFVLPVRAVSKDFLIDGTNILLTDDYLQMLSHKKIYTGLTPDEFKKKCLSYDIELITYLTDELAIKNNYITTEGIIEAIVNQSVRAVYDSKVLIIGYGRLGQIAGNILKSMKAHVTISARNDKDLIHAQINDFQIINNLNIAKSIEQYDFIINTIPFKIIDSNMIDHLINKDVLIIDVASSPYGLDHQYASSKNVKTLLLPGIPGKIAPLTAGNLIGEFIDTNIVGGET